MPDDDEFRKARLEKALAKARLEKELSEARVEKALSEARYIASLTKLNATELVLAAEVERYREVDARIHVMIASWRKCARELRESAEQWRLMGVAFGWHAVRAESNADILETQATILQAILRER